MMDNHKWAERETQALIAAGVNPLDAQRSTAWTLEHMPASADPSTWIPSAYELVESIDKVVIQDALTAWFLHSPVRFKRLLSATVRNA